MFLKAWTMAIDPTGGNLVGVGLIGVVTMQIFIKKDNSYIKIFLNKKLKF